MALLMLTGFSATAQRVITGTVTDGDTGEPLIGASVIVTGTTAGTATDIDGNYRLNAPADAVSLIVTYVGYNDKTVLITGSVVNITMESGSALEELVVIGYGSAKKSDLTGSVTAISEKNFNKGAVTSAQQLIVGKAPGVQITSGGGRPGGGSRIRIRGGSSLNASNDPLIVIDGVPVDNNGISGSANALSLINPADIASFNILKDASATAIYGSRAANGVIIITTKKGVSGKLNVEVNSVASVARKTRVVDVLTGDEFRTLVDSNGTAAQKALLGTENTNWQDLIYQDAFTTDNSISFSGGIKGLPYRLSLGYLDQNGILLTDNMKRYSGALNLNPKFLKDNLSVDLNVKATRAQSHFADGGAIGSAAFFDPTQPVYAPTMGEVDLGGYYEWLDPATMKPNTLAPKNPLSLLEQKEDNGTVNRILGNIQLDYKFPFAPGLNANLNVGYDGSSSEGTVVWPATAAAVYNVGGSQSQYSQKKSNKLLEYYMKYAKKLEGIRSNFDIMGGYTYQDWLTESPAYPTYRGIDTLPAGVPYKSQNTLISFFGRFNFNFDERFLLTATVRRDGSSRFSKEARWGTFPSLALAWRIGQESFLRESDLVSDLKLRLGYGITGQQDIGSDFPYLPRYTYSDVSAQYQFGDNYYLTLRPEGYDANIKWEETTTYNAGIDFGLIEGRITLSADYYFKKTKDLLSVISVPTGSNLTNRILTNVGNIENSGVELNLGLIPVTNENFVWNSNFNITFNKTTITNLSKVLDNTSEGILVGGIGGAVGNTIQIHSVGYNPYAFYVYQQVYDTEGNPIEGLYVDKNQDGVVNDKDKYRYQTPEARVFLGFNSDFNYKNWSLAFSTRANIGNYMYNNFNANSGAYQSFSFPNYLGNVPRNTLETEFTKYQTWSDYYLQNASFFRMDYASLGYDFGNVFNDKLGVRLTAAVQNVFVLTNYTGIDPEIAGGIDNNFYPNPRVFSLALNLRL
jgi:iron complex outermembrane receptor protein